MKYKVPKVFGTIELAQYHAALDGEIVQVWLNPTNEIARERLSLQSDAIALVIEQSTLAKDEQKAEAWIQRADVITQKLYAWHARIWSQGDDAQWHWTPGEVAEADTESPDFYRWLTEQTAALFDERRNGQKKALKTG